MQEVAKQDNRNSVKDYQYFAAAQQTAPRRHSLSSRWPGKCGCQEACQLSQYLSAEMALWWWDAPQARMLHAKLACQSNHPARNNILLLVTTIHLAESCLPKACFKWLAMRIWCCLTNDINQTWCNHTSCTKICCCNLGFCIANLNAVHFIANYAMPCRRQVDSDLQYWHNVTM